MIKVEHLVPGDLVRATGRQNEVTSVLFVHDTPERFWPQTDRLWIARGIGPDAYIVGTVLAIATIRDLTLANDPERLFEWNRCCDAGLPAALVQVFAVFSPKHKRSLTSPAADPFRRFEGLPFVLLVEHQRQPIIEKAESWK